MMNQVNKFNPLAIVGLLKRLNEPDPENGVHENQKGKLNSLAFLKKFSQSMHDQQYKFELPAILALIKRSDDCHQI